MVHDTVATAALPTLAGSLLIRVPLRTGGTISGCGVISISVIVAVVIIVVVVIVVVTIVISVWRRFGSF